MEPLSGSPPPLQIKHRQHHHIRRNDPAKAHQQPTTQRAAAAGKEQGIAQVDGNVAHDGLQTARRNDLYRDVARALQQVEDEGRDVAQT